MQSQKGAPTTNKPFAFQVLPHKASGSKCQDKQQPGMYTEACTIQDAIHTEDLVWKSYLSKGAYIRTV